MKVRMSILAAALTSTALAFANPPSHEHHGSGAGHALPREIAGVSSLDVHKDGAAVHLLVGTRQSGADSELFHLASRDDGATWSGPHRIPTASNPIYPPRRGTDAQLAAAGDRVVVLWTGKGTGFMGSGPLGSAVSEDGGATWKAGANPADDGASDGHAFADMVADRSVFYAVWLDNRNQAQGLRYASSRDGMHWSSNLTLAEKTCECCWNTLTATGDGALYVLYRRNAPRDMGLVASRDAGATWTERGRVGAFGWDVNACPHVGGALVHAGSAGRRELHALAWTGREDRAGLYHLASRDGGRSWSAPMRLGGDAARHAGLAPGDAGALAAVWDEDRPGHSAIVLSVSRDAGRSWSSPRTLSAKDAEASHPRVVRASGGFLVFWTEVRAGAERRELRIVRTNRKGAITRSSALALAQSPL